LWGWTVPQLAVQVLDMATRLPETATRRRHDPNTGELPIPARELPAQAPELPAQNTQPLTTTHRA